MQIQLVMENIDMTNESLMNDTILISQKSFSAWIVDYYFTKINSNERNFIGFDDMFNIYKTFAISSYPMMELCKNKLKQIQNDSVLNDYQKYLNQCELNDIIDIFLQCQLESLEKTICVSIDSLKNEMDQVFFEYLLDKSSVTCENYDPKTKENSTNSSKNFNQPMNKKDELKHTICTYLSLVMNSRNEHALVHCLLTSTRTGFDQNMIADLKNLSKNEHVTMYEYLHGFLFKNRCSSSEQNVAKIHLLDKYYENLKEFFDLIEQLQMIVNGNEHVKIESEKLRQLLNLILEYLQKQDHRILTEILEDFSQCLNLISPIQSALLTNRCFRRSIIYLCAKQTMAQSTSIVNIPEKVSLSKYFKKSHETFPLPTIYETDEKTSTIKRQPLQILDVNSFDHSDERKIECEKVVLLTLVSDSDKENLPVLTKKRGINSTKNEPSNKKQKKNDS